MPKGVGMSNFLGYAYGEYVLSRLYTTINSWCTQKKLFEILLNQTEIRLYLPFFNCFGIKRTSVWFQINRKMVNKINKNLIRIQKVFSVCGYII